MVHEQIGGQILEEIKRGEVKRGKHDILFIIFSSLSTVFSYFLLLEYTFCLCQLIA